MELGRAWSWTKKLEQGAGPRNWSKVLDEKPELKQGARAWSWSKKLEQRAGARSRSHGVGAMKLEQWSWSNGVGAIELEPEQGAGVRRQSKMLEQGA